ncbi:MAG: hypothetical protein U9O49_02085 [Candidatus Thermoplasmatota archaeon]|nr:hypothetical protein [Candidatus Thermoplasmatota archaeon]
MNVRLLKIIAVSIILVLILPPNVLLAESDSGDIVDAHMNVQFTSATDIEISVTIEIEKITIYGTTTYAGNQIQNLAQSTNQDDIEDMGMIKGRLRTKLITQLSSSFSNAEIAAINKKPSYDNERFYDLFNVSLTPNFFGINESINVHNFINGVLDMGARTNYTIYLNAKEGWSNTYEFKEPDFGEWASANEVKDGDRIIWPVNNKDGEKPETKATFSLDRKNPTTSKIQNEDIKLEFKLDTRNEERASLVIDVLAKNIEIREYDLLPDFICNLDFVPSDGIRLLVDNGLLTWEQFYEKTLERVKDRVVPLIENSPKFNQTLDLALMGNSEIDGQQVVPFDISHMDNETSIDATFLDEGVDLRICEISPRALFGLVNVGADVNITSEDINFGEGIDAMEYEYNITIYLPEKITLDEQNVCTWGKNERLSGKLLSESSTKYSKNDINTVIEIEINSIDLNLLSFFTGRTELNFGLNVEEQRSYKASEIPDEFVLPKKVVITYLPSDAFRLCIDDGVFDEDSVGLFLNNEKRLFEVRMESILQNSEINGHINEGVFSQSLEWNGKIASMTETDPIKVASYAHSSSSVAFDLSYIPPSLEINDQHFNFSSLKDQDVTYRIIFPHGTNVELPGVIGKAEIKEADDGRQYIEVSFNSSEFGLYDMVVCKVVPSSPLFIIGIFAPCILSFVVTVILVALVFFLRKKRKGRGKLTKSNEVYEEQEYYVPPRPPARR